MKSIGLIEDDPILRDSCVKYFQATHSFKTIFSVDDIGAALKNIATQPDIILLDINLPSGSGLDNINVLKAHFPASRVVILSSIQDETQTHLALKNGAAGYLLKSSSLAYITESLLKIDEGAPFSPATINHVIQPEGSSAGQNDVAFTKREMELVKLISEGMANKTVADKLNVTYFTVNQHLKNIYKKLSINSKAELIAWHLKRKK